MTKITRVWAMASKHSFKIPPIRELVWPIVGDGAGWLDPFSGFNSPAEFTNDLNPDAPTMYHLDALEFVKKMQVSNNKFRGCIFDPPYSVTQVGRAYHNFGITDWNSSNLTGGFPMVKDIVSDMLRVGAKTISLGWNTVGFGKTRGFVIEEILIVSHGSNKNDTLITVEKKIQDKLL